MFQLWKLVLLCGLLTGTSALLVGNVVGNLLNDVLNTLTGLLRNFDSTLQSILQQVTPNLDALQGPRSWGNALQMMQDFKNWLEDILSKIFQLVAQATGLDIRNVRILDITFQAAPDDKSASLSINIAADISLSVPLLGKVVDLGLKLNPQGSVSIETDPTTGASKVVMRQCTINPDSISLTVLDRRTGLLNTAVDNLVSLVRQLVSLVAQNVVCPVLQILFSLLDPNLAQEIIRKSQPGEAGGSLCSLPRADMPLYD
ncbi:short palate, lung and nasal epithelium carcinoma-associated protein 2A-like [Hippopotamus amphibius kiboko]|uniref:short palate, lung and nasal epithelium carcinoma-associated protein 2A-like n=1 Tax=Hippopotamus amphibius kiboko TaxID=575201 RepID=UPI002596536F|nr:short palate, lung and nasal epithelium carcinoma-associated protein 2A-like [Hippopotamus amphibius kiboko]